MMTPLRYVNFNGFPHMKNSSDNDKLFRRDSCCLPTPFTFASGVSPIFPLMVHLVSSSVTPAVSVYKSSGDN